MANSRFTGTRVVSGSHDWRRALHRGWVDAQNGATWPRDYELMNGAEQIAYESGRLLVREAMAEGFGLCVWRGDKAGSGVMDDLWDSVCRKIGRRITPETWVESSPDIAA